MIKRIFHKTRLAFDLRTDLPINKEMAEWMKSIKELHFDGVSQGKENLRNDFYKLNSDFKKSISEAKKKWKEEDCLL